MKIEVTQEDIAKGVPYSATRCPVALALSRTLEKPTLVGIFCVQEPFYIGLPEVVSANISKMLIGESVEPFSFDLEIP